MMDCMIQASPIQVLLTRPTRHSCISATMKLVLILQISLSGRTKDDCIAISQPDIMEDFFHRIYVLFSLTIWSNKRTYDFTTVTRNTASTPSNCSSTVS